MDHFGIGAALQAAAACYFQTAAQTGRTTSLVESVREGDRIVCANIRNAEELRELLRERSLAVEVVLVPPEEPERLRLLGTSAGRTLFDHVWIEAFYRSRLDSAAAQIDSLQREASGFGTAHIQTRAQARAEHSRRYWRGPGR